MIIGIDASRANIKERTGTEWYSYAIISEWAKRDAFSGHTVRLFVREPLLEDFPKLPAHWEVKVLRWNIGIFWTQIRLSFELFFHRIDCLFVPSHAIPFHHPRVTLTTIHDIGFEITEKLYGTETIKRLSVSLKQKVIDWIIRLFSFGKYGANELDYHRFSTRYALRHATKIFTVSEFTKKEIQSIFKQHPPIVVAYNGVQQNEFYYPLPSEKIEEVKREYGLDNYFFVIGRIEKKKNSFELVRAYETYRRMGGPEHLVFAGNPGLGFEEISNFVEKHKLKSYIHFLEWVPQEHIAPLLAGAKLFLFFSAYEGFGVPLIQSLACGTPVLCSNLQVFQEIGRDAITTCNPKNAVESAQAMKDILSKNGNEFEVLQKRGIKYAQEFTWESTSKIIEKAILETYLLAQKK